MKISAARNMTSEVVSISWGEKMQSAHALMKAHGFRHLPVLDDQGRVIGVLSDRDVLRASQSPDAQVREYMSWPVKEVGAHESIRDAADRMVREKISAVLVMDNGRLAGIITSEDLLKVLVKIFDQASAPKTWSLNDMIEGRIAKLGTSRSLQ